MKRVLIALGVVLLAVSWPLHADHSNKFQLERETRLGQRVLEPGEYELRVENHGACATIEFVREGEQAASVTGRWEEWVNPFRETGFYYRGAGVAGLHFAGHKAALTFEKSKIASCDISPEAARTRKPANKG